jgi:nucleotide-binding universal stress UspA family protein
MDLNPPTSAASSRAWVEPVSAVIDTVGDERTANKAYPQRVLVATDTTPTSAAAELVGIELSSRVGASLVFLSVIDPSQLRLPGGIFHTRVDQVRAQRESALAKSVANARQIGIAAQFLIWEGNPGASVIDAAEAEGADLIIVGSHDRGAVGRLLLGSVSSYVVDHGHQPVLVIRPGQRLDDVFLHEAEFARRSSYSTGPSTSS